jgi:hypothetical protein
MTIKITLQAVNPSRKLVQNFAGCADIEDGKQKAKVIFPGCKILKAEEIVEKKK